MIIRTRGIKSLIGSLIALALIIIFLVLVFNVLLFLIPLIIILGIIGYFLKVLKKLKKGKPKDYIDIKYKIKK